MRVVAALAHSVLRSALSDARRLQRVSNCAAELVKVPKPPRRSTQARPLAIAQRFLSRSLLVSL